VDDEVDLEDEDDEVDLEDEMTTDVQCYGMKIMIAGEFYR
jgi:hypothetical protein